jgi:succinate dehydrogenase/fumarate reductase cytochrome b subunit (b558 family)
VTPLSGEHRAFWLKRLSSLFGVVPLGIFLFLHLWSNGKATEGARAYESASARTTPAALALGAALVLVPLAFHAGYGIFRIARMQPNVGAYPFARNWSYTLERATGALMVAFLAYHLWEFPLQVALGKMQREDFFSTLCDRLSSTTRSGVPLVAAWYLGGLGATAYHVANGLAGFCFTWGIVTSRRAQRLTRTATAVLGIGLFLAGADTVLYFATGASLVGPRSVAQGAAGR